MPLYSYSCKSCNTKYEKIVTFSEPEAPCPICNTVNSKNPDVVHPANFSMSGPTRISPEVDKKIGASAEKRWLEYEEFKSKKTSMRQSGVGAIRDAVPEVKSMKDELTAPTSKVTALRSQQNLVLDIIQKVQQRGTTDGIGN